MEDEMVQLRPKRSRKTESFGPSLSIARLGNELARAHATTIPRRGNRLASQAAVIRGACHNIQTKHRFIFAIACFVVMLSTTFAGAENQPTTVATRCNVPDQQTDVRPNANGPPTVVSVGVRLVDLIKIDDVSRTVTADLAVFLSWNDPRLISQEGCKISLDRVWSPNLTFLNSGKRNETLPRQVSVGPAGTIQYVQRYFGRFAVFYDLANFPLDRQTFRIVAGSPEWHGNSVRLIVDQSKTSRRELLSIPDWKIGDVEATIGRQHFDFIEGFTSLYSLDISARRLQGYYLWKVFVPLCLIVAMSWSVFWVDSSLASSQIGLSATSMLSLIAFIFATTNMLPKIGYLTTLDLFIVGCLLLVFLGLAQSIVTSRLHSTDQGQISIRLDRVCRFAFPMAFLLLVAVLILR